MRTITLLKRWVGIATGKNSVAVKQNKGKYYSKTEIKGYYNNLTGKVNDQSLLDEDGIPINIIEGGKQVYFPISIFQYALGLYDLYLESKKEEYSSHFLNICNWMVSNQRDDGSWDCFSPIGYKKVTVSSMGQGEGASVLLRAFKMTNDEKWLKAAKDAVVFMVRDICDGGTLLRDGNDIIFEEYADIYGEKKSVLNGWIFSLFGLYDYLKIENDDDIREIYENSIDTLARNLEYYDNGYWSLYDRTGRIASPAYHDLHIALLTVLSDITSNEIFEIKAKKFSTYQENFTNKNRAILKKIFQKLKESPEGIVIK